MGESMVVKALEEARACLLNGTHMALDHAVLAIEETIPIAHATDEVVKAARIFREYGSGINGEHLMALGVALDALGGNEMRPVKTVHYGAQFKTLNGWYLLGSTWHVYKKAAAKELKEYLATENGREVTEARIVKKTTIKELSDKWKIKRNKK